MLVIGWKISMEFFKLAINSWLFELQRDKYKKKTKRTLENFHKHISVAILTAFISLEKYHLCDIWCDEHISKTFLRKQEKIPIGNQMKREQCSVEKINFNWSLQKGKFHVNTIFPFKFLNQRKLFTRSLSFGVIRNVWKMLCRNNIIHCVCT